MNWGLLKTRPSLRLSLEAETKLDEDDMAEVDLIDTDMYTPVS